MTANRRNTTNLKDMEDVDAFFHKASTSAERGKMFEAVTEYLDGMDLEGKALTDIKDRNSIPNKIACNLQKNKVEGWVAMEFYHLKRHDFRMFKSLCDLVTNELKLRLTP